MDPVRAARLSSMLVRHEGMKLVVYDDATGLPLKQGDTIKGHPSIGVGRALDVHGISKFEALAFLEADIEWALEACIMHIPGFLALGTPRQDALISMVFGMGIEGVLAFKGMLGAIEREEWDLAAFEMMDSAWSRQVGTRANELSKMMATGMYP